MYRSEVLKIVSLVARAKTAACLANRSGDGATHDHNYKEY